MFSVFPANSTVMDNFIYLVLILLYGRLFPQDRLTHRERFLLISAAITAAAVKPASAFALEVPVLLYAAMIDRRTGEIPDLCAVLLAAGAFGQPEHWLLAAFYVLVITGLLSMGGLLGFGDVKLIAAWTFAHGRLIMAGLTTACWPCLLYCLMGRRKKQIPFAPFLAFGFLFVQLLS